MKLIERVELFKKKNSNMVGRLKPQIQCSDTTTHSMICLWLTSTKRLWMADMTDSSRIFTEPTGLYPEENGSKESYSKLGTCWVVKMEVLAIHSRTNKTRETYWD